MYLSPARGLTVADEKTAWGQRRRRFFDASSAHWVVVQRGHHPRARQALTEANAALKVALGRITASSLAVSGR
jgi:hypothetical protein